MANERIPILIRIPAAVKFVSAEPLLEVIDLFKAAGIKNNHNGRMVMHETLDWVIAGGERITSPPGRPTRYFCARSGASAGRHTSPSSSSSGATISQTSWSYACGWKPGTILPSGGAAAS